MPIASHEIRQVHSHKNKQWVLGTREVAINSNQITCIGLARGRSNAVYMVDCKMGCTVEASGDAKTMRERVGWKHHQKASLYCLNPLFSRGFIMRQQAQRGDSDRNYGNDHNCDNNHNCDNHHNCDSDHSCRNDCNYDANVCWRITATVMQVITATATPTATATQTPTTAKAATMTATAKAATMATTAKMTTAANKTKQKRSGERKQLNQWPQWQMTNVTTKNTTATTDVKSTTNHVEKEPEITTRSQRLQQAAALQEAKDCKATPTSTRNWRP